MLEKECEDAAVSGRNHFESSCVEYLPKSAVIPPGSLSRNVIRLSN